MENGNEMIRIEHLRKRYGDLQVLDDINLTIRRGEKLVILGPSGSASIILRNLPAERSILEASW